MIKKLFLTTLSCLSAALVICSCSKPAASSSGPAPPPVSGDDSGTGTGDDNSGAQGGSSDWDAGTHCADIGQTPIILAYFTENSKEMPDATLLTHINYAHGRFADPTNGSGGIVVSESSQAPLAKVVALKSVNPKLKVMLMIGGWGMKADGFSMMARDGSKRTEFCQSVKSVIEKYGLDGVDIDWEYPTQSAEGTGADASDTRRGVPTVSALLSPEAAVLVGDFWLARAVNAIINYCSKETFSDFALCLDNLAEGEMFQIEKAESLDASLEDYIYIIEHKTAALFRAAMKGGARNSGCTPAQLEAMDSFALHLGRAFQIRDDILDYSPQLALGKPTGVDIAERKITLPLLGAFENAGEGERARVVADIDAGRYGGVPGFVEENDGIEYAQQVLEHETLLALEALEPFGPCRAKELLVGLARQMSFREK